MREVIGPPYRPRTFGEPHLARVNWREGGGKELAVSPGGGFKGFKFNQEEGKKEGRFAG